MSKILIGFATFLSFLVVGLSVTAHFSTFLPQPPLSMNDVWYLHIGSMAVFAMMILTASRLQAKRKQVKAADPNPLAWFQASAGSNEVLKAVPGIVIFLCVVAFFYAAVNFITFMAHSGGGYPFFDNGRYYLMNHGKILREITLSEYNQFKAYELRGFSGHWIIFSLIPAVFFKWVYPATRAKQEMANGKPE